MKYIPIVGLEIHAELNTNSKMFCGCPAHHFGAEPNTQTCPVCLGLPGAIPVANKEAIRRTVKVGLAIGSSITRKSKFDRKNYFYPDLPKGYQISQYDLPFCVGGQVETSFGPVRLERIHQEEDTGKLQHVTLTDKEMEQANVTHSDVSLIDFNRSGVPLMEIVTKPDIHSPEQAREYGKNLVQILRYLNVSDCDMEKGSLRLEANISVQNEDEQAAGKLPPYKVEVKNLNSFRFLERAIAYEIERHVKIRENGELPVQETRGWNDEKGQTYSQRTKEEAEGYRYFPDPDLPAIELSEEFIAQVQAEIPELPTEKAKRWMSEFGISEQNAQVMAATPETAAVSEAALRAAQSEKLEPQKMANALVNHKIEENLLEKAETLWDNETQLSERVLVALTQAQKLYAVESLDTSELASIVAKIVADPANAAAVEKYRAGQMQVVGFFMGQVMRMVGKKIDTKPVLDELAKQLNQA